MENKHGVAMYKAYPITTVCLEDLKGSGFDVSDVDDDTMKVLAEKLGESIMSDFWDNLFIIAQELEIKLIEE